MFVFRCMKAGRSREAPLLLQLEQLPCSWVQVSGLLHQMFLTDWAIKIIMNKWRGKKNNDNESEGEKKKWQTGQQEDCKTFWNTPIMTLCEICVISLAHLLSSCFTVPVIWLIFSSKRAMASLFCLELDSALWGTWTMVVSWCPVNS